MASISVYNKDSTSISVRLTGLQTSGVDYTRKCQWVAYEKSSGNSIGNGVTYITQGDTEGGDFTFTGLSPNTEYTVNCQVYRTDTGAWVASIPSVNVTTSSSGSGGGGGSGGSDFAWWLTDGDFGTLTSYRNELLYLDKMQIYRYSVRFQKSGTAKFYSGGSVDVIGYLSTSPNWDTSTGRPTNYLLSDDDGNGGTNFLMSYDVKSGTTYYIWVRGISSTKTGNFSINIEPPDGSSSGWVWSDDSYNAFLNKGETTDVPYTEWNEFVEYVADKTGYYLVSALMDSSDKTLYADKFNAVREAIGGKNTFKDGTNSIKDHFNSTGSWDMSSGESVKGQYFIDLTEYLNDIP